MQTSAAYFRNQVILGGAVPAVILMWDAVRGQLGANAVNNALHITGILSLVFLFFSLTITPLRLLTGWNWLVASRRSLGLYGFFYAIAHVVIYVAWDRMGSLSSTVEEIISRRFLTIGFFAVLLMIPLAVTSTNAMIRRMGASRWKLLHRLAYIVVILGVVHYYMLVKSDVRQPLAFALVLTPLLGFRGVQHYVDLRRSAARNSAASATSQIDTRPKEVNFFRGELLVANIHQETPDVKTFRLVNPAGGEIPFRHRPGQYMTLHLEVNGVRMRRSYTIASAPSQRGYVELTIKRHPAGTASQFMHDQVRVGHRLQVAAPAGKFWFDGSTSDRVLLIAGGVGITPTMSMLRYLTDTGWRGDIVFLNAIRTKRDIIFSSEVAALVAKHSNLVVANFFSQEASPEATGLESANALPRSPLARYGYITVDALQEFLPSVSGIPVYLCGPEPMMAAMRTTLGHHGVSDSQIHTEEFISPQPITGEVPSEESRREEPRALSYGVSQLTFTRSGTTIQLDPSQTILEAAELNHVRLDYECRSGICGQCKVRCLSGRVDMESADALSHSERSRGWILACQAKAASETVEIDA